MTKPNLFWKTKCVKLTYRYTIYPFMLSVAYVEIYAFFEEDLMDPKSTVGGPKSISRTGVLTSAYLENKRNMHHLLSTKFQP